MRWFFKLTLLLIPYYSFASEKISIRAYDNTGGYYLYAEDLNNFKEKLKSRKVYLVRVASEIQGNKDPYYDTEWISVESLKEKHLNLLVSVEQGIMYFLIAKDSKE
jgi:hypothetical protein